MGMHCLSPPTQPSQKNFPYVTQSTHTCVYVEPPPKNKENTNLLKKVYYNRDN